MREIDERFSDAVKAGDILKMQQLWKQYPKPDVNAKAGAGDTPLHAAASNGNTEAIQLLRSFGADVNAKTNDGYTPLHEAALIGQTAAIQLLKSFGADVYY